MKEVTIEALRPFNKTPQGDLCEVGDTFPVDATRADELERLGLAKRVGKFASPADADTQAAPKPLNKAAPKPKAKG
jgi:hypothetical protein